MALTILAIIALLVAARIGYLGALFALRWNRLRAVPTVRAADVRIDTVVEVTGTAECDGPATTPFRKTPCVECRWSVEAYRRHKNSWRWEQIAFGLVKATRIWIRDDSGRIAIGESKHTLYLDDRSVSTDEDGATLASAAEIDDFLKPIGIVRSSERRRYIENTMRPGDKAYALGRTRNAADGTELAEGPGGEVLLANLPEGELAARLRRDATKQASIAFIIGAPAMYALWWTQGLSQIWWWLRYRIGF